MSKIEYDYTIKYIIIGNAAVGKSNIILKYTRDIFTEEYQITIGAEYSSKDIIINNKQYQIQIWDTAGQEYFRSIIRSYYNNSACAIVVYDITSKKSFNDVENWIDECTNNSPYDINLVLVGNKIDLENERVVSYDEGKKLALKYNMLFFECSAKTGKNINNIFNESLQEIDKKIEKGKYNFDLNHIGIRKIKRDKHEEKYTKKYCCK
jgi:small GTP-binding protein